MTFINYVYLESSKLPTLPYLNVPTLEMIQGRERKLTSKMTGKKVEMFKCDHLLGEKNKKQPKTKK